MEMPSFLKNKSLLWGTLGIVVLVVGIVVALQLLPQDQDIRQEAAVPGGPARVRIAPSTLDIETGETESATFSIHTNNLEIISVQAAMVAEYEGDTAPVTVNNIQINNVFNSNGWSCGQRSITDEDSQINIAVTCIYTGSVDERYKNNTFVDVFTFDVTGTEAGAGESITFEFDEEQTVLGPANNEPPYDIANIPTTRLTVNVSGETPSPSPSPSPTATPNDDDDEEEDDDDDHTPADKRILLNLSGLQCGANDFTAKATVKEDDDTWQDVNVTFKYNGQEKTAFTSSEGVAQVTFPRATTNQELTAEATDFDTGKITVSLPSCGTSTTTGASCNQSCTASRDCAGDLTCVSGVCRASRCPTDAACGCEDVDVAAQNGDTELPESGFDQTMAMTVLGLLFLIGGSQLFWGMRARK